MSNTIALSLEKARLCTLFGIANIPVGIKAMAMTTFAMRSM